MCVCVCVGAQPALSFRKINVYLNCPCFTMCPGRAAETGTGEGTETET